MADAPITETKPCTKCGEIKPLTREFFGIVRVKGRKERLSSSCRTCDTRRTQEWRAANPEAAKARNRLGYERHREAKAEYGKQYREANKERIAIWQRDWFLRNRDKWYAYRAGWSARNKDKIKGYALAYIARDPERYRAQLHAMYEKHKQKRLAYCVSWRAANPEARRALATAYRARKRGAGGSHTAADISKQFSGQKGRCWWCQVKVDAYHVDHRIPLKLGGSNGPENIVIACPPCNQRKAARMPWETQFPRLI